MKKIHLLLISALLITACQQAPKPDAAASSPTPNYPYKIKHPDNWDIDTSHNNTMVALNALKSYETMDTALMKKCFSDSITLNLDSFTFKGTNAQFIKMAMTMGASMKNYKIDMKDWEAVVSKDKTEEWVTVWYTQHWANATGKTDSVQYVDDVKLKGGKIIKIDEYGRHFPKK